MAITSSITTTATTISSSVYLNATTLINTITFDSTSNQISQIARNTVVTLSVNDFLSLISFDINFNTMIKASFIVPQGQTTPFSSVTTALNDDGTQLTCILSVNQHPLLDWTCPYNPWGQVVIGKRNTAFTMSYAQWLYELLEISNFKNMVQTAYKI